MLDMSQVIEAISKPPLRPNLCVESRGPILEIVDYYCGCPPLSALISNLIEGFEIDSRLIVSPGTHQAPKAIFLGKRLATWEREWL